MAASGQILMAATTDGAGSTVASFPRGDGAPSLGDMGFSSQLSASSSSRLPRARQSCGRCRPAEYAQPDYS